MPVEGDVLIQSPAGRAMIYNKIPNRITAQSIIPAAHSSFAPAETEITDNYVMRVYPETFTGNTDAAARCCLSCNSYIRRPQHDWRFQMDDPCYVEDDGTCTTSFTSFS